MIPASAPNRREGRLLVCNASGGIKHFQRSGLGGLCDEGDLVIANDAATLPASLTGVHENTQRHIEVRLAAWTSIQDASRFVALVFGPGDYRTPTEKRDPPPTMRAGDRLVLGPLVAVVERLLGHPRLLVLHFPGGPEAVLSGLARHGRPIQYAHVPEALHLWDVWTTIASNPIAFEPPSAGFALDWQILAEWKRRGVHFSTLSHAAGISSTGDAKLDRELPLDEPYFIPVSTAELIRNARARGHRVIAIGTSVVRALESSAHEHGRVTAGHGLARIRIGPDWTLRVADSILTGMHAPGESHFELLRAFATESALVRIADIADREEYRAHEFGDFLLLDRPGPKRVQRTSTRSVLSSFFSGA